MKFKTIDATAVCRGSLRVCRRAYSVLSTRGFRGRKCLWSLPRSLSDEFLRLEKRKDFVGLENCRFQVHSVRFPKTDVDVCTQNLTYLRKKNIDLTISVHANIRVLLLANEWNETRVEIILDREWRMGVIWKLTWFSMADERQNGSRVKPRFLVGFENIQKHSPPPTCIRSKAVTYHSGDRFRVLAVRN